MSSLRRIILYSALAATDAVWTPARYQTTPPPRGLLANPANSLLVVDANNVRGTTAFRWSALDLALLLSNWADQHALLADKRAGARPAEEHDRALDRGPLVVCWDHGLVGNFSASWRGVSHIFAGPRRSADDLMVAEIRRRAHSYPALGAIWLATSDRELASRARAAAAGTPVRVHPLTSTRMVNMLLGSNYARSLQVVEGEEEMAAVASDAVRDESPHVSSYRAHDAALREHAAAARRGRRHERKRARVHEGQWQPIAEKTWHRVLLAESLRRMVDADGSPSCEGATAEVATRLVDDVRLDKKQRAKMLRFGASLLTPAQAQGGLADERLVVASSGAWSSKRRLRRQRAREPGEGSLVGVPTGSAPATLGTRAEETDQRLDALHAWICS